MCLSVGLRAGYVSKCFFTPCTGAAQLHVPLARFPVISAVASPPKPKDYQSLLGILLPGIKDCKYKGEHPNLEPQP